ncbi:MAG: hypothetical protein LBU65_04230, partial [Planctomycetaceae bacterium]|nr:hypothetical protein [Planctomycetaceae bacterium]
AQKQKELDKVLNNLQTYFESGAIGMQEMLEAQERAKIAFTESEQKAEPVGNKPVAQTAALERGTAAYYAAINQRNDPQLNEAKKQTKTLETIAKNTKPQTTLEPQYADIA